jgi:hypothetical protein
VTTLAGRRRPLLHIREAGRKSAQAERQAVNTVCQVRKTHYSLLWAVVHLAGESQENMSSFQSANKAWVDRCQHTSLLLKHCVARTLSCCRPAVCCEAAGLTLPRGNMVPPLSHPLSHMITRRLLTCAVSPKYALCSTGCP